MGKLVVAVVTLVTGLLKPNAGGDVVGTLDPKAVDGAGFGAGFVVFTVDPNVNMDGLVVPTVLAAVLADNVPNPMLVFEANVGLVTEGLPKLNVGGADVDGKDSVFFALPNTGVPNVGNVLLLPVDCGNPKEITGVDF